MKYLLKSVNYYCQRTRKRLTYNSCNELSCPICVGMAPLSVHSSNNLFSRLYCCCLFEKWTNWLNSQISQWSELSYLCGNRSNKSSAYQLQFNNFSACAGDVVLPADAICCGCVPCERSFACKAIPEGKQSSLVSGICLCHNEGAREWKTNKNKWNENGECKFHVARN